MLSFTFSISLACRIHDHINYVQSFQFKHQIEFLLLKQEVRTHGVCVIWLGYKIKQKLEALEPHLPSPSDTHLSQDFEHLKRNANANANAHADDVKSHQTWPTKWLFNTCKCGQV